MLKKIAIFLFVLLLVQMALYARLYGKNTIEQSESINAPALFNDITPILDASAFIKEMGIKTRADETVYPETYLVSNPINGNTLIHFHNPESKPYRLDIYDEKGLVASFVNLSNEQIEIDKTLFASGAYLYKLSGETNLYCGTFVLN